MFSIQLEIQVHKVVPIFVFFQEGIEGEIPYVTSEYNYNILGSGKLKKKKRFKKREYTYQCDYT